jgi:hypothetical protein
MQKVSLVRVTVRTSSAASEDSLNMKIYKTSCKLFPQNVTLYGHPEVT